MSLEVVFTSTLVSPGGHVKLNLTCSQCCTDIQHCTALLPNGKTIYEADKATWSPDERFAVICKNSFHDTPCGWYEVWDMVDGEKIDTFVSPFYEWSPNQAHSLVYLVQTVYIGTRDPLVMFDASTGEKTYPEVCPDWFYQQFRAVCNNFPKAIVGGRISGLPEDVAVKILVDGKGDNRPYGQDTWRGNAFWARSWQMSFGMSYVVTAEAEKYTSDPISYTIQLSGTKIYTLVAGHVVADEAGHLDFRFVPAK